MQAGYIVKACKHYTSPRFVLSENGSPGTVLDTDFLLRDNLKMMDRRLLFKPLSRVRITTFTHACTVEIEKKNPGMGTEMPTLTNTFH